MTIQEKEEKYDQFMSHELNLFIFYKDHDYFFQKIRPLLACKLQKSLIDKFLLSESLEEYFDTWTFLNSLEQVLVIIYSYSQKSSKAKTFAEYLSNYVEANPVSAKAKSLVYKKVFNSSKVDKKQPPPAPPMLGSFIPTMSAAPVMALPRMFDTRPDTSSLFSANGSFVPQMNKSQLINGSFENKLLKYSGATPRSFMKPNDSIQCEMLSLDNRLEEQSYNFDMPLEELKEAIEVPSFYKKMDATKEYIETNYYNQKQENNHISINSFWAELASEILKGNTQILSESVIYATSSLTELVSVLAFTNLPFVPNPSSYSSLNKSLLITAKSNFLIFYKDLLATNPELSGQVLAAHRYFDPMDKYLYSTNGERTEKVVKSFIRKKLYECTIVISNISGQAKNLNALQISPNGSIPIAPSISYRNLIVSLEAYSTSIINYSFYFPEQGSFSFFPANIAENEKVVAVAITEDFQVLDREKIESFENFSDVVLSRDSDKICEYLESKNPFSVDYRLDLIYFMLKNKEFYERVIEILKKREIFNETIYSFSLFHKDVNTAKLFIRKNKDLRGLLKHFPNSFFPLQSFTHSEFNPLVNARAHQLAQQKRIANPRILEVYKEFLLSLALKPGLNTQDKLRICQYLIYQDNLKQASTLFSSILDSEAKVSENSPGTNELQLQIDYMGSFLSTEIAIKTVPLYENYPIKHWRKLFHNISEVLLESNILDSSEVFILTKTTEPSLNFKIVDNIISIAYINVKVCTIKLYIIDLEIIFSRNPFLTTNANYFSFAKPNREIIIDMPNNSVYDLPLPTEFQHKNIIVEIDNGTYTSSVTYYATELRVNTIETLGVIKVMDASYKPRPGVYVKVYAELKSGGNRFYKDGFTDIIGKFDFVSLSSDFLNTVKTFSILLSDPQLGSLIIQANPPK